MVRLEKENGESKIDPVLYADLVFDRDGLSTLGKS